MHTKDTVPSGLLPLRLLGFAQGAAHLGMAGLIIAPEFGDPDDILGVWFAGLPWLLLTAGSLGWLVARADRRLHGMNGPRGWAVLGAAGFTAVSAFLPLVMWAAAMIVVGGIGGSGRMLERSLLPGIPGVFMVGMGAIALWGASRIRQNVHPRRDSVGITDVVPSAAILGTWIASLATLPAFGLIAALCELQAWMSASLLVLALVSLFAATAFGASKIPESRPDAFALRLEIGGAALFGGLVPLFIGCLIPLWGPNEDAHWSLILMMMVLLPSATAMWSAGRALRQDVWLPETSSAAA
jgi:hypothetical protein